MSQSLKLEDLNNWINSWWTHIEQLRFKWLSVESIDAFTKFCLLMLLKSEKTVCFLVVLNQAMLLRLFLLRFFSFITFPTLVNLAPSYSNLLFIRLFSSDRPQISLDEKLICIAEGNDWLSESTNQSSVSFPSKSWFFTHLIIVLTVYTHLPLHIPSKVFFDIQRNFAWSRR